MYAEIKETSIDARSGGLYVLVDIWLDNSKSQAVARNDFFWPNLENTATRIVTDEDGNLKGTDGNWYAPDEELPEGVEYEREEYTIDKVALIRGSIKDYWKRRKRREFYANAPGIADVQEYPYQHTDGKAQPQKENDPRGLLTPEVLALEGTVIEEAVVVNIEWPPGSGRWWELVV